jgi:asparagine synthase (glutamine-hydrolysing)
MCGIAGIFAYHYAAPAADREELDRICRHMRRRGPDAEGFWYSDDQRVALGHRRLAIIDLSEAGRQPMATADGTVLISFNGEIYNYRALRDGLQQRGRRFRTQTDTEVLIQLYQEFGTDMFSKLRGMYAFGLWDARKRALLLARDPYGIKPLYYADDGWTLRFASQVKALLAGTRLSRAPDPAGWAGFYLFGSVPEPYTCYREIRSVPAGSFLWVTESGTQTSHTHWSVAESMESARSQPAPAEPASCVRQALRESVRHHLVADVPVGSFLSAGIDSTALLGLMRDESQGSIRALTLGFEEYRGQPADEVPLAAQAARHYGADHLERRVDRAEFLRELPKFFEAMDQPSIDGINSWFVSKAAAEQGLKVAISGLGGDELFGGYPSFERIPRMVNTLRWTRLLPGAGWLFRAASRRLARDRHPKLPELWALGGRYEGAYLLQRGLFLPRELGALLREDWLGDGLSRLRPLQLIATTLRPDPGSGHGRVAALEASLYMRNQLLRDTDWAGMAHSIEVRVPLVDHRLFAVLAPLIRGRAARGKGLLAAAPAKPLPESVRNRPKTGFTTPVAQWLQQHQELDAWRRVPALNGDAVPWARRWAYVVADRFLES